MRAAVRVGGLIYLTSAGALHFFIGSLADWTSRLAPLLGRDETVALIQAQYDRLMPAMLISYAGMLLIFLGSTLAVLMKKRFYPGGCLSFTCLSLRLFLR